MQSVIHLIDYPLLPEDDSITASFPDIAIRSDTGNEEQEDHDHDHDDEGDDHDHDVAGDSSGAPGARWTVGIAVALLSALSQV